MSLGEVFQEAYSRTRERSLLKRVYDAIDAGLWPWKPGKITAWTEQELTPRDPKLIFEIDLLPDLPFVAYPDVIRHDFTDVALKLADEAFKFYRNRPALPVDDHIVLGED